MEYILYDGTSSIEWESGTLAREEMDGNLQYPPSDQPCVLIGIDGIAYDWRYLKVLCEQNGVEFVEGLGDYQETFDAVLYAIENQEPKPTLESIDAKATEAQTAATEAKTTADTANQTATTVQEQMDALTSAFDTEVTANA